MNSNPVNKNYIQEGMQAHEKMREYFDNPESHPAEYPEVFSEEASRARHLLHQDGCPGHSTFRHGEILTGPAEDQSLTRMMEKKISGGE